VTREPTPVGSVWESYDGTEVYLVLARDDEDVTILFLESSPDRPRPLEGRVVIASLGYLHGGKRIA
jgi:hypothetical protein